MPRATVTQTTENKNLKTCEGGVVTLRRMSWGDVLTRRTLASVMQMSGDSKNKSFEVEMILSNEKVTLFEFSKCIVDHNLEDEKGVKLNLTNINDIKKLDPKIGGEIDALISDMNNFEDEEGEEGPTPPTSDSVSEPQLS